MPYLVVANPSARSGEDLAGRAERELPDARLLRLDRGVDLGNEVRHALADGWVVVACGGDGTVNSIVQHVAGTEGVLGVLPGGTFNHFAKDLGVDDVEVALDVLRRGAARAVDIGRAGDRAFVNNVSVGLYAELVRERGRHEDQLGKWRAAAVAAARVVSSFEPFPAVVSADGDARLVLAALVFVANNRVSSLARRARLDAGVLDVRVLRARAGLRSRSGVAWGVARGRTAGGRVVRTDARAVELRLPDRAEPVAFDGEQDGERTELSVRIEPGALRVLRPS